MMKRKNMHMGAKPSLFRNADKLRRNPTEAEEILWNHLQNRQMEGVRFRRQHPMKKFVADFYAHQLKFAIEVDGGYHMERVQQFYDKDREEILIEAQVTILRFTNEEVFYHLEAVLACIREKIIELKSLKQNK